MQTPRTNQLSERRVDFVPEEPGYLAVAILILDYIVTSIITGQGGI